MPEAGRQRCVVPFCRRTRQDDGRFGEWCCGRHWCAVPRKYRRVMFRARRRGDRMIDDMAWRKCKRIAIERALGIG